MVQNAIAAIGIGVLAILLASPSAEASEEARRHFSRTDANSDEAVSEDEYRHRMIEVFFAADDDKDGALQRSELAIVDTDFDQVDSDGDGRIELSEFLRRRMQDFRFADVDGDGYLDFEEVVETYLR